MNIILSTEYLIQIGNDLKARYQTNRHILLFKMKELEVMKKYPDRIFSRKDCLELCLVLCEPGNLPGKNDIEKFFKTKRDAQITEIFACKKILSDFLSHLQLNLTFLDLLEFVIERGYFPRKLQRESGGRKFF